MTNELLPPRKLLLVEGGTDYHVVKHLSRKAALPDFCVHDKGSVDNVLRAIATEVDVDGRLALGVLVDADEDFNTRWNKIAGSLRSVGIETQDRFQEAGTIIDDVPRKPRVGIWVMPNNKSAGEIENFLFRMVPNGDPLWPLAQNYIGRIPNKYRKFVRKKQLRAGIHAWLSAQERPWQPGMAITTGDFRIDNRLCRRFTNWLHQLFT